jgi:hypothetical protein
MMEGIDRRIRGCPVDEPVPGGRVGPEASPPPENGDLLPAEVSVRTFDLDAYDAFGGNDRPGEQILPWEMWERERPWRHDSGRPESAGPAQEATPAGDPPIAS